jgi:hypothetical protein
VNQNKQDFRDELLRIYTNKHTSKHESSNLPRTTSLTHDPIGLSETPACEEINNSMGHTKKYRSELQVIGDYKQSKAFKTLLRRQSLAVSRISRIKESFTKKRMQIHMLAVKQDPNASKFSNDYECTKPPGDFSQLRQVHLG